MRLAPEGAAIGVELCLLGNDAGNKFSIGRAEISRMDSNALDCGYKGHFFCNVNYISATFSAVGGSSGSPAIRIDGDVVALQSAGMSHASIDYLLPIDLPLDVLELLRQGKKVTRGTLQTKWSLLPLNECERYKLPTEWHDRFRSNGRKNVIRADVVLPKGPADRLIEIGDVLLEVDGELMFNLIPLERHMNAHVGETVRLKLWRTDRIVEAKCHIGDLHAIVPHRFITQASANFHQLSYQQALEEGNIPVEGVWVAGSPSTDAFRFEEILVSINNEPVTDLDRFDEIISKYDAGGFITTCHKRANDISTPIKAADYLLPSRSPTETEWSRESREGGRWRRVEAPSKPSQPQPLPLTRLIVKPGTVAKEPKNGHGPEINTIFRSMVWFKGYPVVSVEEDNLTTWNEWGLIVNKEKDLIMAR